MSAEDGLPLGFPAQGAVTICRTPVVAVCQAPGCVSAATWVTAHIIEQEDSGIRHCFLLVHFVCDVHAAIEEHALRGRYTLKPPTTLWRDIEVRK